VMLPAMEADLVGGAVFASSNTQNFVLSQMNILTESCVFGNVSNQAVANHTAVAVGATIQVAEERHSIVVANHCSELEQANLLIKHFQELALRQQGEAAAHSAQASRLREIEIAYDIQNNEIATMKRERESTLLAAQARACAWAAANPPSSSGEGNQFHSSEDSAGPSVPVQPGRLESLAHVQDSVGHVKGSPSEPTTTCETAVGHDGSEGSVSDNRFLFPYDLTTRHNDKSASRPIVSSQFCALVIYGAICTKTHFYRNDADHYGSYTDRLWCVSFLVPRPTWRTILFQGSRQQEG
jgi:hypothetical protein